MTQIWIPADNHHKAVRATVSINGMFSKYLKADKHEYVSLVRSGKSYQEREAMIISNTPVRSFDKPV